MKFKVSSNANDEPPYIGSILVVCIFSASYRGIKSMTDSLNRYSLHSNGVVMNSAGINNDFNHKLLELSDNETDEIIQIEYYPSAEYDIKYHVILRCEEEPKGTVAFIHQMKNIEEKELSKFETKYILNSLSKLVLPVMLTNEHDESRGYVSLQPDVKSAVVINTDINKTKFEWFSSDESNYPNKLEQLINLVDMINDLIEPDTSNLFMPIYY